MACPATFAGHSNFLVHTGYAAAAKVAQAGEVVMSGSESKDEGKDAEMGGEQGHLGCPEGEEAEPEHQEAEDEESSGVNWALPELTEPARMEEGRWALQVAFGTQDEI